jgi:hypothetical protein
MYLEPKLTRALYFKILKITFEVLKNYEKNMFI